MYYFFDEVILSECQDIWRSITAACKAREREEFYDEPSQSHAAVSTSEAPTVPAANIQAFGLAYWDTALSNQRGARATARSDIEPERASCTPSQHRYSTPNSDH